MDDGFQKYFQLFVDLFGLISEGTQRVKSFEMVLWIATKFAWIDFGRIVQCK